MCTYRVHKKHVHTDANTINIYKTLYDDDNQLYIFQAIMRMITLYYITDLYLISSLCICFKKIKKIAIAVRIFTAWKTINDEI